MQIVTIAGATGKDAVFKTTQGGETLCQFSVAVSTGWGDRKATTWWDVTRWGKGAEKLSEMLPKGTKVTVIGEVSTREHEGKTYLQCRADHVALQGGRSEKRAEQGDGSRTYHKGDEGHLPGYDDDSEVPF